MDFRDDVEDGDNSGSADKNVTFFGTTIPMNDKMVGWKSNANFFPCNQAKTSLIKRGLGVLACGSGKKEDIPARLSQLQLGGLDTAMGEDKIVQSINTAIEYVASVMMKTSTSGSDRHAAVADKDRRWLKLTAQTGKEDLKRGSERWKNFEYCDGGFWADLGKNDYDKEYVSWGVADETVFSNTAVPPNEHTIVLEANEDELMYGGTICGTAARRTKCFQYAMPASLVSETTNFVPPEAQESLISGKELKDDDKRVIKAGSFDFFHINSHKIHLHVSTASTPTTSTSRLRRRLLGEKQSQQSQQSSTANRRLLGKRQQSQAGSIWSQKRECKSQDIKSNNLGNQGDIECFTGCCMREGKPTKDFGKRRSGKKNHWNTCTTEDESKLVPLESLETGENCKCHGECKSGECDRPFTSSWAQNRPMVCKALPTNLSPEEKCKKDYSCKDGCCARTVIEWGWQIQRSIMGKHYLQKRGTCRKSANVKGWKPRPGQQCECDRECPGESNCILGKQKGGRNPSDINHRTCSKIAPKPRKLGAWCENDSKCDSNCCNDKDGPKCVENMWSGTEKETKLANGKTCDCNSQCNSTICRMAGIDIVKEYAGKGHKVCTADQNMATRTVKHVRESEIVTSMVGKTEAQVLRERQQLPSCDSKPVDADVVSLSTDQHGPLNLAFRTHNTLAH